MKSGHLLYATGSAFYYGRQGDRPASLKIYSIKDRKETTLADDIRGYDLSMDGSKVLVGGPGASFGVYDATPQGDKSRKPVSTAGLAVDRVPAEEWNQIFNEVWRRYRDFFYVPNMHGYDWVALREQYKPLLKYVAHRSDLNYVIAEMISELTVQHAYVEGGDFQIPPRPRVALPGARFELDQKTGRYRIAKIFQGQNEEDIYRSPLTEVGVNVSVGDYVLAINGEELTGADDPYRLLRNKADSTVQLTVNKEPTMTGARTVTYRPITNESDLILPRLGERESPQGVGDDRRARRLHSHSRYGRGGHSRVHQVVLRSDQQGRTGRRRARERRRQRLAHADRAASSKGAGAQLLAHV